MIQFCAQFPLLNLLNNVSDFSRIAVRVMCLTYPLEVYLLSITRDVTWLTGSFVNYTKAIAKFQFRKPSILLPNIL
jgi:hypothetical protein